MAFYHQYSAFGNKTDTAETLRARGMTQLLLMTLFDVKGSVYLCQISAKNLRRVQHQGPKRTFSISSEWHLAEDLNGLPDLLPTQENVYISKKKPDQVDER